MPRTPKQMHEIAKQEGYGPLFSTFGCMADGLRACDAVDSLVDASAIDTLLSNFIIPLQSDDISKPDASGEWAGGQAGRCWPLLGWDCTGCNLKRRPPAAGPPPCSHPPHPAPCNPPAPLYCRCSSSTTPSPRARSSATAPRPKQPATRAAQQPLRRRPALPAAWRALPAAGRRCSCGCGCGGQAPPAQYTRKKHSKKNTSHSTAPHSTPTLGRPRSTRLVQPASAPLPAAAAPLSAQFGRGRGGGGGSGAKLGSETAPSSAAGTTP